MRGLVASEFEVWGVDGQGRERGARFEVYAIEVVPGERRLERLDGARELGALEPGTYYSVRRAAVRDDSPSWANGFFLFSSLQLAEEHGRKYLRGAFKRFLKGDA